MRGEWWSKQLRPDVESRCQCGNHPLFYCCTKERKELRVEGLCPGWEGAIGIAIVCAVQICSPGGRYKVRGLRGDRGEGGRVLDTFSALAVD